MVTWSSFCGEKLPWKYNQKFRTKKFRELYAVLSQLNISVKSETFTSLNEDLNKTVAAVQDINKGKFVKSVKLNENSDLAKQNLLNNKVQNKRHQQSRLFCTSQMTICSFL